VAVVEAVVVEEDSTSTLPPLMLFRRASAEFAVAQ
jgi:hypothetical protein